MSPHRWLKVQTLLKDYHESLQLALEVSSFYQQADSILGSISDKVKTAAVSSPRTAVGFPSTCVYKGWQMLVLTVAHIIHSYTMTNLKSLAFLLKFFRIGQNYNGSSPV